MSDTPPSIHQIAHDFRLSLDGRRRKNPPAVPASRKRGPAPLFVDRNDEMRALRYQHGWKLQAIADKYGISRERVRQIIGNTGFINQQDDATARWAKRERRAARKAEKKQRLLDEIRSPENTHRTNTELAEMLGVRAQIIADNRADLWHVVEPNSWVGVGQEWETWVSNRLTTLGIGHRMMPPSHPFDILLDNGLAIDVKSTSCKMGFGGPETPFRVVLRNYSRGVCDFLIAVIREHETAFIVPTEQLPKYFISLYLHTTSKFNQYREAWHLITGE